MDGMDVEIFSLFKDVNGIVPFTYKGSFSYDIGVMIEEFNSSELTGMNRNLNLESKAYGIFVIFLE